ncbi:unnamed protein product (macronuclear) [Paramecium tetraurelia]|uniref:Uncharacterized protein n=1 Tax=Paramecium tetraurelia TaxID=5888 RepID=A0BXZ5_PARTE|nr:uncharacterized protein GSPATT00033265001 [Paramecium tetraurelia]CAK63412.1 unnamed protein product [Paramecium tetraurelia]|eukprot:XP_001430810.1 hypothetical protein (macronuclear) [Paramecium tetraurelia strain d4-2]
MIGKVTKIQKEKKKKKWWQYLGMFAIGLGQFLFGCAVTALTCGAALPIGKTFITGGISDMVYSVTAAWKGLDIDWGAWGQNKMINIASALVLAGPSGIKEALEIGCKGFQSLQKIGITEFLKQIPRVTVDGLKKAGFWLSDLDKADIKNQYQTLQQIQEAAFKTGNVNQLLNLATEVLNDQVQNGVISKDTSKELFDFINRCFQESKGTVGGFQNRFCEEAKKYLKLQITKKKTKKSENELKQEAKEICSIQGNKKYHGLQSRIEEYKQYEQRLNNEIKQFKGNYQICYNEDFELQKNILLLDIYFEKQSNQKEIDQIIKTKVIQNNLISTFDINDEDIQHECDELKIPNKQSMNNFYQKVIRPQFMKICELFKEICKNIEPMAIIFKYQYGIHMKEQEQSINNKYFQNQRNQFNRNSHALNQLNQSIDNFNHQSKQIEEKINQMNQINQVDQHLLTQNIINELKNKQLIKNDGITISNTFMTEFQNYLNHQNYNNLMIQILQQTMESTLQELAILQQNSLKKLFSTVLFKVVEIEILDEIEKYIFKSRIKKQDSIITSQYD